MAVAVFVPGGGVLALASWLRRRWLAHEERREQPVLVSADWLKDHQRKDQRIEFHSAPFAWPIKKVLNESSIWNREKLRKRA